MEENTDFKFEFILYLTSEFPEKPRFRDLLNVTNVAVGIM